MLRLLVVLLVSQGFVAAQARWELVPELSSRRGFALAYDAARGETVLFGGSDGVDRNDTWVWNGVVWQQRFPALRPSPRSNATMAWDSLRQRIVLFGGDSSTDLWAWNGTNWSQLLPSTAVVGSGSPRFLMHDPGRDRLVLLTLTGNQVAISESNFAQWVSITPTAQWPPHSYQAACVFDPVAARATYLPIGNATAALWRWNGTNWTSQTVTGGANQFTATLVHDPVTPRLLLAGGVSFTNANTLFGLNSAGTAWLPLATGGPNGQECRACFETLRNRVVLVGGAAEGTAADSSVWESSGGSWQRRTFAPPAARRNYAVAHDRVSDRAWLFGGQSAWGAAGDLWSLDAVGWQLRWRENPSLPPFANPGTTSERRLVYDEVRQELLLMAGDTSTFPFWRWSGSAWQSIAGIAPPARLSPGVVFDRKRGRVVLFGGRSSDFQALSDTWVWNGTAWSQLFPATVPQGRYDAGIAYDVRRDRVVLCGGQGAPVALGETWEFNGVEWQQYAGGGLLPGTAASAMTYDTARQVVVAVIPASTGATLRTWQWNGVVWSETFPVDAPPTRSLPALLPTNNGVLSFGGVSSNSSGGWPADRRWLRTPTLAAVQAFGAPGTSVAGPLTMSVPGTGPWLGERVVAAIAGLPSIALPGMWAGASRTEWAGQPLPLDLGGLGWSGTAVRIAPEIAVPVLSTGNGDAMAALDLPASPALAGVELHLQAFVFEPLSGALTSSNGLTLLTGLR
jgi:hypothetical protein